ncbi:MAG: DNA-binding response regulator [Chloroflexota bacterium]
MSDILVVDDDEIVARTIERSLRHPDFHVTVAHSGVEALQMARRQPPDLMILDVLMPGMDGYEVCRQVRADPLLHQLPILFLTARAKEEDRIEGFRAGADDYLPKPFNVEELVMRVKAILRRAAPQPPRQRPRQLRVGNLVLDCNTFEVCVNGRRIALTPVQFDLLYHLMSHAGQALSAQQLLQEVWDYPYDAGSPDLVRVHIKNLREKLEPNPAEPIYLRTIQGHGYMITVPGSQ